MSKGIGSKKEQSCSLAPRSTVWEHRNALYCFLLHALCQAIIWALISIESHETWKGRPGKRFYEAVKMEFVFQLQFTEHRGKKGFPEVDQHTQAYLTLFHTIIPRLSCL